MIFQDELDQLTYRKLKSTIDEMLIQRRERRSVDSDDEQALSDIFGSLRSNFSDASVELAEDILKLFIGISNELGRKLVPLKSDRLSQHEVEEVIDYMNKHSFDSGREFVFEKEMCQSIYEMMSECFEKANTLELQDEPDSNVFLNK